MLCWAGLGSEWWLLPNLYGHRTCIRGSGLGFHASASPSLPLGCCWVLAPGDRDSQLLCACKFIHILTNVIVFTKFYKILCSSSFVKKLRIFLLIEKYNLIILATRNYRRTRNTCSVFMFDCIQHLVTMDCSQTTVTDLTTTWLYRAMF